MALLVFSVIFLVLVVIALFNALLFLLVIFYGAPFIPTDRSKLATIVKLAELSPGQKAVDLGSGNGRIVLALAQSGAEVHGYEINPVLAWWSAWRARKSPSAKKIFIQRQNFWSVDLSGFDVVTVFGIGNIMPRLAEKLNRELAPGARVVSNGFSLPGWVCQKKEGQILLYIK